MKRVKRAGVSFAFKTVFCHSVVSSSNPMTMITCWLAGSNTGTMLEMKVPYSSVTGPVKLGRPSMKMPKSSGEGCLKMRPGEDLYFSSRAWLSGPKWRMPCERPRLYISLWIILE